MLSVCTVSWASYSNKRALNLIWKGKSDDPQADACPLSHSPSVGPWHAQHMLSNVRQHKVIIYRRCLVQTRFTEFPLDVVLGGKAVAAVAIETGIGCLPGCFSTEVFGHIRLGPAWLPGIEHSRGFEAYEVCGFDRHVGLGNGKLHTLVGADGFPEDHPIFRVLHGFFNEPAPVTHRFRGYQDALGIHAIQDIGKPLALLADETVSRNLHVVEKEHIGRMVQHGA